MNLQTRREILNSIRIQYQESDWQQKSKILDGFIAARSYFEPRKG
jgi:cellobiose phosphorylase